MSFVEGRDQTRDHRGANVIPANPGSLSPAEPLPGIPAHESRLLHAGAIFDEAVHQPHCGA